MQIKSFRLTMRATALVVSCSAASLFAAQAAGQWKPLFNGKDLAGWTVAA